MDTITSTLHPHDLQYQQKRAKQINTLLRDFTTKQINDYLVNAAHTPVEKTEREEQRELTKRVLGEMMAIPGLEKELTRKSILDSTGGGTSGGSVLIRQDLEAPLIALFIKSFPAFERIKHAQSNGLTKTSPYMLAA